MGSPCSSAREDPRETGASSASPRGPFRALAQSVATGVVLLDAAGRPAFLNDAASRLLGIEGAPDGPAVRKGLASLVPADRLAAAARDGATIELPPAAEGRDGLRVRAIPLPPPDAGVLLLIEKAHDAVESNDRRTAKHDLKAPLNALAIHVELLRQLVQDLTGAQPEPKAEFLATTRKMHAAIQRFARQLDDFLDGLPAGGGT